MEFYHIGVTSHACKSLKQVSAAWYSREANASASTGFSRITFPPHTSCLFHSEKDFVWVLLAGTSAVLFFSDNLETNSTSLHLHVFQHEIILLSTSEWYFIKSHKKGFFFLEITLQRELPQSAMCALSLSLCSCSIKAVWKLQLCVHCHSVLEVRSKVMICKVDPPVILSLEVQFCRFCCQPVFRVQRVLHDLKAAAGNSQFKP